MAVNTPLDEIIDYKDTAIKKMLASQEIMSFMFDIPNINMESDEVYNAREEHFFDYGVNPDTIQTDNVSIFVQSSMVNRPNANFKGMAVTVSVVCNVGYIKLDKKKFKGIVYKRRLAMPEAEAKSWLSGEPINIPSTQIAREIDYFRSFYPQLTPHIFLAYDRTAWYCTSGSDLRITFDENIRFRTQDLQLSGNAEGHPLLAPNQVLMEIKTGGSIPLWLTQVLTQNNIFKTSYSKYGNAYLKLQKEGVNHYVR